MGLPVAVLPQEAEIDSIHQLVVGATENIKEGNEDIREVSTLGPPGPPQCGTESRQQRSSCWQGGASALLWPRAHLLMVLDSHILIPAKPRAPAVTKSHDSLPSKGVV